MQVVVNRLSESESMRLQTSGQVGIITLNRPNRRNALTQNMWKTLQEWCDNLPEKVKLLIIRGSGEEFTAGSDIKEFATLTETEANEAFETMERAIHAVETLNIPTIAAVSGPAYGAGFVLSLACDLRIGTGRARFGMPVGRLGITLQPPFIHRMMHYLGPSRTMELVYTAKSYDAQQAYSIGLLNAVVEQNELTEYVLNVARSILEQSYASILSVKESVRLASRGVTKTVGNWVDKEDFHEGVKAFNEKRSAQFSLGVGHLRE